MSDTINFGLIVPKYQIIGQTYNFNYGLALVSACMKRVGLNVFCLNMNHYTPPAKEQVMGFINKNKINVVYSEEAFLCYKELEEIFDTAKRCGCITVAGGTIVSNGFCGIESIDYGIVEDTEEVIVEIAGALINKRDVTLINGISFFKDGKYVVNPPGRLVNPDTLPVPDYDGFEYGKYMELIFPSESHLYSILDDVRPGNIIASRSCPYRCTFCCCHLGRKYRQRSLDHVFEEIDYLVKTYNINYLNLWDFLFSFNKERLMEFAKKIKKYNIKWWAQMRVSYVDKELVDTLKDSGMFMVSYGIESVNNGILRSMKKTITKEEIENALKLSHEAKLNIQGNIIIGDVEDTVNTVNESIEWLKKHNHYGLNLVMIRTIPGSILYERAVTTGRIKNKMKYLNNGLPPINNSKMSDSEYQKVTVYVENQMYDDTSFFNGKVMKSVKMAGVYTINVKCPHCGSVSTYKNMHHTSFKTYLKIICRDCHVHLRVENIKAYKQDYTFYGRIYSNVIKIIRGNINKNIVWGYIYFIIKKMKNKKIIKISDKYI